MDTTQMAAEIGELRGRLAALEAQVAQDRAETRRWREDMTTKIDGIYGAVMSAKGGVRAMIAMSTVSAAIGGLLVAVLNYLRGQG